MSQASKIPLLLSFREKNLRCENFYYTVLFVQKCWCSFFLRFQSSTETELFTSRLLCMLQCFYFCFHGYYSVCQFVSLFRELVCKYHADCNKIIKKLSYPLPDSSPSTPTAPRSLVRVPQFFFHNLSTGNTTELSTGPLAVVTTFIPQYIM